MYLFASYASDKPDEEERRLLSEFFVNFPDQCTTGPAANCYTEALKATPPRLVNDATLFL